MGKGGQYSLLYPWVAGANPVTASFCIRPRDQKLASGAEVGAAVLHRDPLDGAAANGAGFVSLMSNLEIEMGYADSIFVFFSPDPLAGLEFPVMRSSSPGSIPS